MLSQKVLRINRVVDQSKYLPISKVYFKMLTLLTLSRAILIFALDRFLFMKVESKDLLPFVQL